MATTKHAKRNGKNGSKPFASVMDVESWPIDRVIPYARNPRKNEHAVAKVAASLKEFGWRQPIVVDKERVIIVGHTRLLAARQLEMTAVPVHVATNLTPAQVKAYRLADNRIGQDAEWDNDLLALEFNDLELADFDMHLTGFNTGEIDEALGRSDVPGFLPATPDEQGRLDEKAPITCPNCHHEFRL